MHSVAWKDPAAFEICNLPNLQLLLVSNDLWSLEKWSCYGKLLLIYLFFLSKLHQVEFLLFRGIYMIRKDFSVGFEWLSEDWQSFSLGLTPNFGLTGCKTHNLLYYVMRQRAIKRERADWRKRGGRQRRLKEKWRDWKRAKKGKHYKETDGWRLWRRGGSVWQRSDFSFGTVNNSPCLSWTAFMAPFVCSDILGSLREKRAGEGSASRVFTGTVY